MHVCVSNLSIKEKTKLVQKFLNLIRAPSALVKGHVLSQEKRQYHRQLKGGSKVIFVGVDFYCSLKPYLKQQL